MAVRWYLARNRQKVGPFSPEQLKQLAGCGVVQPEDHVLVEGAAKWVEARQVPGLFAPPAQTRYWLSEGGQTRGPYAAEQIQAGLTTRRFTMETQVYSEKSRQWLPLRQATEFRNFTPDTVSRSRAQLLAGTLDLDEARLHLAGKQGDDAAQLMSLLLDLKRAHENNPDLIKSLDRSLALLQTRRDTPPDAPPKPPDTNPR